MSLKLNAARPLAQATTAVRLSAGTAATRAVSTVVRLGDSRREQSFDITVKVCPALQRRRVPGPQHHTEYEQERRISRMLVTAYEPRSTLDRPADLLLYW
jgi:hypothetical protein